MDTPFVDEAYTPLNAPSEGTVPDEDTRDNTPNVVFSIWSTMMGSTVLLMPQTFRNAGVIPAVAGICFMAALTSYTAVLMTRLGERCGSTTKEVIDTMLNRPLQLATLGASMLIFCGASMLFHEYITKSLLAFVSGAQHDTWRYIFAGMTAGVVFLVSLLRSLKPLFVASSFGIVIIALCSVFIIVKSIEQLIRQDCTSRLSSSVGVGWEGVGQVAALMSTLTVSFFCHNFVMQLLSESTRPEKNSRNVFIAFGCTCLSYAVPSAIAVIAFRNCGDFDGDFIEMFTGPFSDVARVAIILLVLVIYPIVVFIARTQLMGEIYGLDEPYSYVQHLLFNGGFIAVTTLPAMFNVQVTVIAALVGIFGTYWNLLLPASMTLRARYLDFKGVELRAKDYAFYVAHGAIALLAVTLMIITVLAEAKLIPNAAVLPPLLNETTP